MRSMQEIIEEWNTLNRMWDRDFARKFAYNKMCKGFVRILFQLDLYRDDINERI